MVLTQEFRPIVSLDGRLRGGKTTAWALAHGLKRIRSGGMVKNPSSRDSACYWFNVGVCCQYVLYLVCIGGVSPRWRYPTRNA